MQNGKIRKWRCQLHVASLLHQIENSILVKYIKIKCQYNTIFNHATTSLMVMDIHGDMLSMVWNFWTKRRIESIVYRAKSNQYEKD